MNVFQIIYSDYKEAKTSVKAWLFYRRQSVKMSLAIWLADMKQKAWNRQYHVMLMELSGGEKLVSVCREDISKMKSKKWLPQKANLLDLRDSIFYSTPVSRNNKSSLQERNEARNKYLKYAKRYLKL